MGADAGRSLGRLVCHTTGRAALAIATASLALAAAGCGSGASGARTGAAPKTAEAPAPSNKLLATVSPTGREVTLTDSHGRAVTRLPSGWYSIFVSVNARGADFHLSGPGVDSATKAKIPGVALWGIHLLKGTYRYSNDRDAHAGAHVLSVY